jgi:hypothetical protein
MKSFLLSSLLVGFLYSLFLSCTVYYKTNDIDQKLKSSVSQVNINCSSIQSKIGLAQANFNEMNCDGVSPTVQKASEYLKTMHSSMYGLTVIKDKVNNEYENFAQYSKGKTQIQSNSEEWGKFKKTKKNMKTAVKDFQKKGKELSNVSIDFSKFTSKEFAVLRYVDVETYNKKFNQLVDSLVLQEKELFSKLKVQEGQIIDVITKKGKTHPEKCKLLNDELFKVLEEKKVFLSIKTNINQTITAFRSATAGFSRVYSCSKKWGEIQKTEVNMLKDQKGLQLVILNLQQIHTHMQEIITSMN